MAQSHKVITVMESEHVYKELNTLTKYISIRTETVYEILGNKDIKIISFLAYSWTSTYWVNNQVAFPEKEINNVVHKYN